MVEVHHGCAVTAGDSSGLQGADGRAGADIQCSGGSGFLPDGDISRAAGDHHIAAGEVQGAGGFLSDPEIA